MRRTGTDWKSYQQIQVEVGQPAAILWAITTEGVLQTIATSTIVAMEAQADSRPQH